MLHKFSVDCASYMTLIVYGIRWNELPYAGQKVDFHIVSIDSAQMFSGLRELHDPG